jgi:DNA-binding transcriptional ArsR family regulator
VSIDEELLNDAHILLHPLRYRIMEQLSDEEMHINALSDRLGEERRLVSYHLLILEEQGFLESNYEISEYPKSKGKAIKRYKPTEKLKKVTTALKNLL